MSTDQLIVDINKMFRQISDATATPTPTPSPSIRRVSDSLRSTSDKAYDPMVISIGPLHHGKGHLKDMQNLKMTYLKDLVGGSLDDSYVKAIREMEKDARAYYADTIELTSDEFVQMLLLDGSFIIHFLRNYEHNIHLPGLGHGVTLILRDLMLFENQIPLRVLEKIFELSKDSNKNQETTLFGLIGPFLFESSAPDVSSSGAEHLLALVHYAITLSFHKNASSEVKMENIRSASELKEAGVIFEVELENSSWLDITFKNKIIHFPALVISDVTEPLFKNMIAYEYYLPTNEPRYFTDYAFFLQCLVHSSKDAELLRRIGIISNWLGGDARVYEVIERLGTNAQPSEKFSYSQVFCNVNRHCKLRRNKWLAVLRRNHFNNPWTAISLFAAAVLLTVSIVQMVYGTLSYHHRDRS